MGSLLFNPYVLIAIAVFFFSSMFGSFRFGEHTCEGQHARADLEQKVENDKQSAARKLVADVAKADADKKVAKLETDLVIARAQHYRDVANAKSRIPANVTPLADSRCTVPAGFVGVWNESVRNPDAVGGPPAAATAPAVDPNSPSGVALSTVAEAAVENHGSYWDLKRQWDALNKWADEVEALYARLKKNAQQ